MGADVSTDSADLRAALQSALLSDRILTEAPEYHVEGMFRVPLPGQAASIDEDPRWRELVQRVGMSR